MVFSIFAKHKKKENKENYRMKKDLFILVFGLVAVMPAQAQWTNWNTSSAISGVFGAINLAPTCLLVEIGIFISGLEGVGKTGFTNIGFMVNSNYRE